MLWALGESLVGAGKGRDALHYLELAARTGLSPLEMALMSVALAQASRANDAIAAARAATSVAGDSTNVLALVGRAMLIAQRPAEARQYLRRLVTLDPTAKDARRALDSLVLAGGPE
jgi:predicted Zn-dependent protease